MSHILFISPYYLPEKAAAAICVSENAKRLAERGHHVTVLTTFPNHPTGIVPIEYRGRILQKEVIDGVEIIRVWKYMSPNRGFFRRVLSQFSFGIAAPLLGWRAVGHPDIIIVHNHPLFNTIAVCLLSWLKHCPFIVMIADLWPESAVQLGKLRNPILIRLAEMLEWFLYSQSCLVWVVTAGIRDKLMERGLLSEKILFLKNGVDTKSYYPVVQAQARIEVDWDDQFIVLYAGTHGLVHGLSTVIEAAELLEQRGCRNIRFVFVGDGAEKTKLIELAYIKKLENILFMDALPHQSIPSHLRTLVCAADVCLAHTRRLPLFEGMLPIKMFESMSCGRPVILGVNGEARQLLKEADAGLYVEPENPEELASAILYLQEHPEEGTAMGQRGREYAEKHFDYDLLVARLDTRIGEILGYKVQDAPAQSPVLVTSARSTSHAS